MQRQIYNLSRLLGINRNAATSAREWEEGVPTVSPTEVHNLRPHPRGGLTPMGKLSIDAGIDNYPAVASFTTIGYDQAGYATFRNTFGGASSLVVHDGTTSYATTGGDVEHWHIPEAGALATHSNYSLLDENSTLKNTTGLDSLSSHTASPTTTGGDLPTGIYSILFVRYFKTARGFKVINGYKLLDLAVSEGPDPEVNSGNISYVVPVGGSANEYLDVYVRGYTLSSTDDGNPNPWKLFKTSTADEDGTFDVDAIIQDTTYLTQTGLRGAFLSPRGTNIYHNGRLYSAGEDVTAAVLDEGTVNQGGLHLFYAEQGWINLADVNNYFSIPALSSRKITALVSSSGNEFGEYGGLLIFCENEIWVMTGEPALGNVRLELYPVPIGCDEGTIPAVSGSKIFTIWGGELYAVDRGNYSSIGRAVSRRGQDFIRVVIDHENSSIVATVGSDNYRYFYEYDFWCNDLSVGVPVRAYPTPASLNYADTTLGDAYVYEETNTGMETPSLKYERLDFDDQASSDKLCDVRTFVREQTIADGTDGAISVVSKVKYRDTGNEATITARRKGRGDYYCAVPHAAQERSREIDLELELAGLKIGDVLESPLQIGWVRGYKSR